MAAVFNVLTHAIVLVATLAMCYFVYKLVEDSSGEVTLVLRTIAVLVGFLAYFGARALGISIPDLLMYSVGTTNVLRFGFIGFVFPSLTGAGVAWFLVRSLRSHVEIGRRVVIMISTFFVVMFADVYAASRAMSVEQGGFNVALLPNLAFTIGMGLYLVLRYVDYD